jgi:LCP family protein required for cell wall assembly
MTEKKSAPPKKHWLIIAAVLVVACMIGAIVYYLDGKRGRETDPSTIPGEEIDADVLEYDGRLYRLKDRLETVLIMGLDTFENTAEVEGGSINHQQADFLLLLLMDKESRTCVPLHINRDTISTIWLLDIYGEPMYNKTAQIALAHAYGSGGKDSCRNQVRAVSELLFDRKVDHYIALTMDAVAKLNDLVGGVTVTVTDDFSAVDPTLVRGEEITLKGEQALTYVRQRYDVGDASNLSRMARQRQYMEALRQKLTASMDSNSNFAMKVLDTLGEALQSDCSAYKLAEIAEALTEFEMEDFETIAGEAVQGEEFIEFYADEDALLQQVIDLFFVPVETDKS